MSDFLCGKCDTPILDTDKGYVTECEHYPIENRNHRPCPKCGAQIFDPLGCQQLIHDVNACNGVK